MIKDKKVLHNISSKSWEHPADKMAMAALRQLPELNQVLSQVLGFLTDKSLRLLFLASSVRVSPTQYPVVYRLHREACRILDAPYIPELYVAQNPVLNAGAVGVNKPFIVLNSALIQGLDEAELQVVIAHELGHCLSGHALYKTLLALLLNLSLVFLRIPLAELALQALVVALREWDRKSELSADRAGLLVAQSPEAAYNVCMKLAGGTDVSRLDMNEFFKQASEYESGGDVTDSVYKILNLVSQTHPFPVLRLTELKTWVDSGQYEKILAGDYTRRAEDKEDLKQTFEEATHQFEEELQRSEDPLSQTMSKVVKDINKSAEQVSQFFSDLLNNDKK